MSFRTSLLHSCFSPDLNEPQPSECRCRKLVTRDKAVEMVKHGEADWIIRFDGEFPGPTWNIAYRGRMGKTPRAQTIEKAHIERALEYRDHVAEQAWFSDEGQAAKDIEDAAMGDERKKQRHEIYHDLAMETRYRLFHGMNDIKEDSEDKPPKQLVLFEFTNKLLEHKKFSDTFGTVDGEEGKYVTEVITGRADQLKSAAAMDDPYEGRTLFPMIGFNQRTKC